MNPDDLYRLFHQAYNADRDAIALVYTPRALRAAIAAVEQRILDEAARVADLGVPSRDWHAQGQRDPETVEAIVARDIAVGVISLKDHS